MVKRFVPLICLLLCSLELICQSKGTLTLHGKLVNDNSIVNEVKIEIYKDNELSKNMSNLRNGAFTIVLDLGSVYNVAFKKEGFITKSVAIIAAPDSFITINGRFFFQLDIELLKQGEEEKEIIIPPVAKLYIKNEKEGFKYDKNYVRWVAGHFKD